MSDRKDDLQPYQPPAGATPSRIEVTATYPDGGMVRYEIPVVAGDEATLSTDMNVVLSDHESRGQKPPVIVGRTLTITARIVFKMLGDLRDQSLYRVVTTKMPPRDR